MTGSAAGLRSSFRGALGFLILLSALPAVASAQEVRGTVVEASFRSALPGAMVLLLDESGRAVTRVLSGRDGSFRLTAPAAGRYRLRVEHIGFENTVTDPVELSPNAPVQMEVVAAARAIQLEGLEVSASRRCEVRPTRGAAAVAWEEARKALAAAEWTAGRDVYQMVWTRYERQFAASGRRVLRENRTVRQVRTVQPFVSPDLAMLMEQGFVQTGPGGQVYAGPDASVLLSDGFLDTHCFSTERRREGGATFLGLRFEPIPDRDVPEIEGVMWLDEAGGRLRRVEYSYMNLGRDLDDEAFGEMTFRELPNGTWIIEEWRIRIPVVVAQVDQYGDVRGYRITGYHETGGLVTRVTSEAGELVAEGLPGRAVRGTVQNAAGRPVAGARVWVEEAPVQVATDSTGAFELPGLGDGVWRVAASTPELEALGFRGEPTDVDVGRTNVENVRIRLPSAGRVALERCDAAQPSEMFEGDEHDDARGILIGRVLTETGGPVGVATVHLAWTRYALPGQRTDAVQIREMNERRSASLDENGGFLLCNVPLNVTVRVEATTDALRSPLTEMAVGAPGEVAYADLILSLPNTDRRQDPETPQAGVFGSPEQPIALPGIDVTVAARVRMLNEEGFYQRQQGGAGVYLTPEAIEALSLQRTRDLFLTVPGMRFITQSNGQPVLMSSAGLLVEQRDRPPANTTGFGNDPRTCLPMIYLDGGLVQTGGLDLNGMGQFDLNSLPANQLLAVEVYRGESETPARFTGPSAMCGVVVIWTIQRVPPPAAGGA